MTGTMKLSARNPQKSIAIHTRLGRIYISRDVASLIYHLTVPLGKSRAARRGSYDDMMDILRGAAKSMPNHFTSTGREVLS